MHREVTVGAKVAGFYLLRVGADRGCHHSRPLCMISARANNRNNNKEEKRVIDLMPRHQFGYINPVQISDYIHQVSAEIASCVHTAGSSSRLWY
jgi:hypothetical protein